MENFRYCEECNTKNEIAFKYCKNCGTLLLNESEDEEIIFESEQNSNFIDDVSLSEIAAFAGKNGNRIAYKWGAMHYFGRRTSWCWPAFLLSLFFGLAGAGFWFLYRRMYRFGVSLLAISLLIISFGILTNAGSIANIMVDVGDCFELSIDPETGYIDGGELLDRLEILKETENAVKLRVFSNIMSGISLAAAIAAGLFSLTIYGRFATKKIKSYGRQLQNDELSLSGGTAGGSLIFGMLSFFIASLAMLLFVIAGVFA